MALTSKDEDEEEKGKNDDDAGATCRLTSEMSFVYENSDKARTGFIYLSIRVSIAYVFKFIKLRHYGGIEMCVLLLLLLLLLLFSHINSVSFITLPLPRMGARYCD